MNKKEFLGASWPHGLMLKVDTTDWFEKREPFIAKLIGLFDFENLTVKYLDQFDATYTDNAGKFKLILHPLDLTKEIEHKGEKFIPIVELAKLAGHKYAELSESKDCAKVGRDERFCYDNGFYLENKYVMNKVYPLVHQFKLSLKLIEWHFNLMDEGEEFIDVNTLLVNPYK